MKRQTNFFLIAALALGLLSLPLWAQSTDSTTPGTGQAVRFGVAPTIDELARRVPKPTSFGFEHEVPNRTIPAFLVGRRAVETSTDPLRSDFLASRAPSANLSFDGYDNNDNGALIGGLISPPDINGDVGVNFYVQYVNLGWVFFNKSNGSVAGGPFVGNIFWQGFGGVCDSQNAGDPIVLYDHLAGRWVFSQFTSPSNTDGHQCFAISQGSNPAGPYFLYDFTVSPGEFNDYPKISLWSDGAGQSAYHMMTNNFGASFSGVQVTAFDRDAMLSGANANFVRFNLSTGSPTAFGIQPAHLEGPAAPAGTCPLYVQALDEETWGVVNGSDGYRFWEFCTNWGNLNTSTFSETSYVTTGEFDAELCGFSRDCIQQPGTAQNLDTLGQFTMYRFQNRFIGGNHFGVINHTVDSGGDIAGIRWAQFAINSAVSISIAQTGTLAPGDGESRWGGSVAMDGSGNIGLSYTRSSNSTFPSIYFTGNETTDAAGSLQTESACVDGTGSQLGSNRWVDYSSISVDPVDGCTFWLTNEYVQTTGTVAWKTRVCSFSFPSCGAPANTAPTVNITAPANGSAFNEGTSVTFAGTATDAEDGNIAGNLAWTSSINGAIGSGASFSTSGLSAGSHTITAAVTDSGGLSDSDSVAITINTVGGGDCTVETDFENGFAGWVNNAGLSTCSTGTYVIGNPTQIINSGVTTQVGGDNTSGTGNALFTAVNISAGNADVDGGVCVVDSPVFAVNTNSDLTFYYFHGQRDAGDDPTGDFFSVEVSTNGGSSYTSAVSIGDVTSNAVWTQVTVPVSAGSNVTLRVSTSDGAGPGDLVEGGIDDFSICSDGSGGNTAPTVSITAPANGSSFSQGANVSFTGTATDAEDGNISGSITWSSSLDGSLGSGASVSTSSLSVGSHTIAAAVTDSGGLSNSDSIQVTINAIGGGCSVVVDFESGAAGWTNAAGSTCSSGAFVLDTPSQQTNSGVVTQVGGDNTLGNGDAVFTATNISAGNADVDGGNCILLSPVWSVTDASTLEAFYFHGQRDTGDDPGDDFFLLEFSTNGGASFTPIVSIGDVRNQAAWTAATAAIPAGSSVQLRMQVSDGAGPGDLVEGGLDDVSICN